MRCTLATLKRSTTQVLTVGQLTTQESRRLPQADQDAPLTSARVLKTEALHTSIPQHTNLSFLNRSLSSLIFGQAAR